MKSLITTGFSALALTFSLGTMADSENWDPEKIEQVGNNRCSNAGKGNLKEVYDGECQQGITPGAGGNPEDGDGQSRPDTDPGNSTDNNNVGNT